MGPNFICIGAPKTGTTWLYKNLSEHPEVWVPPVKELNYFNRKFPVPRISDSLGRTRGDPGLFPGHRRKQILRTFGRAIQNLSLRDFFWSYRYFGKPKNDTWYLSLFNPSKGQVSGDFTAEYCVLAEDAVQHIYNLLPDIKVIFIMRDPIERAWSQAKMRLPEISGKPANELSMAEYLRYITHPAALLRGDYLRTISIWESVFPAEHLFYGFYDEISISAFDFLLQIQTFLGISTSPHLLPKDAANKVNASTGRRAIIIPPEIHDHLIELYTPVLHKLSDRFQGYPARWLENALGTHKKVDKELGQGTAQQAPKIPPN